MATTPPRTEPPYVPLRHTRWPVQRTPRWLLVGGLLVVVAAVLVGLAHRPTRGQRAADMNGFLTTMTTDIQSCSAGVSESLYALQQIESGKQSDVATAVHIAQYGAGSACSPASNSQLDDLTQYQVQESLASFHLDPGIQDLVTWAFPYAQYVQQDVAQILLAHTASAKAAATAKLARDRRVLDAERAKIYAIFGPAKTATAATVKLPPLPG